MESGRGVSVSAGIRGGRREIWGCWAELGTVGLAGADRQRGGGRGIGVAVGWGVAIAEAPERGCVGRGRVSGTAGLGVECALLQRVLTVPVGRVEPVGKRGVRSCRGRLGEPTSSLACLVWLSVCLYNFFCSQHGLESEG